MTAVSEQTPISHFLKSEQDEGKFVSNGHFRIDWERAQERRKSFTFEQSHQWFTRFLQVLVRSRCSLLKVGYGRRSLKVWAKLRDQPPRPEVLFEPERVLGEMILDFVWGLNRGVLSLMWSGVKRVGKLGH